MIRIFYFKLIGYHWYYDFHYVEAYDLKQARKLIKKKLSIQMSVPDFNSYIKAKNIRLRYLYAGKKS